MQPLDVYRPAAATGARYRVIYGGAGSGKSVFSAMDHLVECERSPGERVLVLRKVAVTLRASTFALFRDVLSAWEWRHVAVNKTEMSLTWPNGSQIIHAGLDDVEKLKSVAGVTRIWIEEATELDTDDLAQVDLRLRGVPPERHAQITYTFNPTAAAARLFDYVGVSTADLPSRTHRLYDGGNVYVQHTTYLDNPHVGAEYVAVFARLGGVMQAVYERGELVAVDAPDQLIRYEWVKAAFERDPAEAWTDGRQRGACDVARFGDDDTVTVLGEGLRLEYVEAVKGQDTTATGHRVVSLGRERGVPAELFAVDTVGLGSGAADTARSLGYKVTEFIAGASPRPRIPEKDGRPGIPRELTFNNLRSQAWWFYRAQMEAGTVAFSRDLPDAVKRKLQEDLLAPRYRVGQEKRIEVEPKEGSSKAWGIKARLGRSPDYGDAEVMRAFADHLTPTFDPARGAFG